MMDKAHILKELKKHKGIHSDVKFAEFLEISSQNLSAWYKRGTFDVNKLVDKFPDVNRIWLLTGEGDMLKPGTASSASTPVDVMEIIREKDRQIDRLLSLLEKK